MHQAAFDALGIEAYYALWETQPAMLAERIASLRSSEVLGANVTIPFKEDVVPFVDECDPLAMRIGAINTVVNQNGRLVGYNTDAPGFIQALAGFVSPPFDAQGKRAAILGTGGAARAAAVALLENGIEELALLGRSEKHVTALVHHLQTLLVEGQGIFSSKIPRINGFLLGSAEANTFLSNADLVVNATPVGLKASDTTLLFDINVLPTRALVMDMIFNPPLTPFLSAARACGCRILNGLSMLLYQGALSFELWTGHPAPVEIMQAALGLEKGKAYYV
jgi:shikimate dehydrogenase